MLRREPCAESLLTQWTLAGRVTSEHSSCLEVSCVAESFLTQRTLAASALVSHLDLMNQNTGTPLYSTGTCLYLCCYNQCSELGRGSLDSQSPDARRTAQDQCGMQETACSHIAWTLNFKGFQNQHMADGPTPAPPAPRLLSPASGGLSTIPRLVAHLQTHTSTTQSYKFV